MCTIERQLKTLEEMIDQRVAILCIYFNRIVIQRVRLMILCVEHHVNSQVSVFIARCITVD